MRAGRRVDHLVDDHVIAGEQRDFHGRRRNHERLGDGRDPEQQEDDGDGPVGDEAARFGPERFRFAEELFQVHTSPSQG